VDDLSSFCCLNPACPDLGKRGHGNLTVTARYGPNKSRRMDWSHGLVTWTRWRLMPVRISSLVREYSL
jgi:hypothetical protein